MRTPTIIRCHQCDKECGRSYPDRWSSIDGGEPGFREGIGENYVDAEGRWHCSQACLDKTIAEMNAAVARDCDQANVEEGDGR